MHPACIRCVAPDAKWVVEISAGCGRGGKPTAGNFELFQPLVEGCESGLWGTRGAEVYRGG